MKPSALKKDWLTITDPSVASVLLDPDWAKLLKAFMEQPRSVKEAASYLNLNPARLYYPVRRLLSLGILELAFERPRKGRPIKHYQSCSGAFFIPFRVTSLVNIEEFIAQTEAAWSRQLIKEQARTYAEMIDSHHLGLKMWYRDGFIWHDLVSEIAVSETAPDIRPEALLPGVASHWGTNFYLSDDDTQRLCQEVYAILEHYRQQKTGQRRVLHFAIAPWRV